MAVPQIPTPPTAILKGTVVDFVGAPLRGAEIVVLNEQSRTSRKAIAGDGSYIIDLEPGRYTVEVEATCWKKFTRSHLRLRPGSTTVLNIELKFFDAITHIKNTSEKFSFAIARQSRSGIKKDLIERAEGIRCEGGEWAADGKMDGDGVWHARCLNSEAIAYYSRLFEGYKKGTFPALPIINAQAYYGAEVEFEADQQRWVVKLRFEYQHYCGNVCAVSFAKTRTVVFDRDRNVLGVMENQGAGCGRIS